VRLPWSGQAVPDADGEWTTNDSPASGDRGAPLQSVGPLIDPTGSTIERINDSCRVPYTTAPDSALPYEFMVGQGEATVTLRFADITPGDVLEPSFAFKTYGADTETAIPFYNVAIETLSYPASTSTGRYVSPTVTTTRQYAPSLTLSVGIGWQRWHR